MQSSLCGLGSWSCRPTGASRTSTPSSLRALAHPLRLDLLGQLRVHGPATASGLARRLGESSGLTSYHLRQLADAGLIEDDPDRGNGRERWWRAAHDASRLEEEQLTDPDDRAAAGAYKHLVADAHHRAAQRYLAEEPTWDPEWRASATLSDVVLHVTPDELTEVVDDLLAVLEPHRARAGHGPVGAEERVVLVLHALPQRGDT